MERIVYSAIPKNTQKATQFGMSVFSGEYADFFLCYVREFEARHSQLYVSWVLFNVDKQRRVCKLALKRN